MRIEIQYIDTDYAARKTSLTTIHEKQVLEFDVHKGKKYRVRFAEETGVFEAR
ncbi:MAG: hypothetical protein LBL26_02430 [Peptococcaceae bacterium]|jgi:hypothetical protein|nr:hypothetical protein [Peptococcaceae bacterium]